MNEEGYGNPPTEEWPGSLVGMKRDSRCLGDLPDWFYPYQRFNEAAVGSGPPDLTIDRTVFELWLGFP